LQIYGSETAVMKVAISTWNGRVSPVFDVARTLLVLEIGEAGIAERREQALDDGPAGRIERIVDAGVKVLLCGAISQPLAGMLAARGVRVVPFISGDVEEVIRAYLAGALGCPRFAMPGCHRRRMRVRGGGQGCVRKDGL
jgi:predicted Fe-Mo cluster-binding NifX family protein